MRTSHKHTDKVNIQKATQRNPAIAAPNSLIPQYYQRNSTMGYGPFKPKKEMPAKKTTPKKK